ncbi:MAG: ABC transporter permease subunit [Anaerolineae bacterium]|nr:ABC transporter permease subunit [Anaerolineae bacterium]
MNWRAMRAVIRKDLTVVLRSKAVILPIILLPLIMQVILPAVFGAAAYFLPEDSEEVDDLGPLLDAFPEALRAEIESLEPNQLFFMLMTVYTFAPMYLIVPLMTSSVIAADSFVGERERKTLEALLYTPLTDMELIVAKLLTGWIPALVVAVVSFLLYMLVVNAVGWPLIGRLFFPNWTWIVLVFWVAPAVSMLGLGLTVVFSSRVQTFQEAYQLGSMGVLPIVALMLGQIAGLFFLSVVLSLLVGLLLWVVDAILLWFSVQTFQRSELLARM